jgi:hypothetical protein
MIEQRREEESTIQRRLEGCCIASKALRMEGKEKGTLFT